MMSHASTSSTFNPTVPMAESGLSELNETVSRLSSYKGVELVQILNCNGDIITESISISSFHNNNNNNTNDTTTSTTNATNNNSNGNSSTTTTSSSTSNTNSGTAGTSSNTSGGISTSITTDDGANGADSSAGTVNGPSESSSSSSNVVAGGGSQFHATLTRKVLDTATSYIRSIEPDDEITFVQVRSKNGQELLIAPQEGYVLAVLKR